MRLIPITEELRDYIQRLNYEENRLKDLLNIVTKDGMTAEEWDSSWQYFTELYEEAKISKETALEEIKKINDVKEKCWCIDFK